MATDLNPQAPQMADESMVRNLAAQAQAIWPQEVALFRRYGLAEDARIVDAGCGTGEISSRLAELFPRSSVLGVDVLDGHLDRARERYRHLAPRLRFENRSVFQLGLPDHGFDLTVCRHVLQAIPHADRALAELVRVTRPGGRIHLVAEDYGMVHFPRRKLDPDEFWWEAPRRFGAAIGTDMFVGRKAPGMLRRLGVADVAVDYVVVDTLRVPRPTFAAIWEAWRDGYAAVVAEHTRFTREEVVAHFEDMIETIRDPEGYAAWMVPVVSGVVP
jgi:ubiquinone/menaquinone biosynthesis C-methylase UbiE